MLDGAVKSATELMTALFFFFFTLDILSRIVLCTNAHATQTTFTEKVGGQVKYRGPPRTPEERSKARQWCVHWEHELTLGELVVFLGIVIKMGTTNHKRLSHYWIKGRPGFGDALIESSMTQGRFLDILANLSFMAPGDPSYPGDRLRKIRWVNDELLKRAQAAWNPEQHAAIDESMIACVSRMCGFRQMMKCKPIKNGIKVFCFVFSKSTYLWNWRVFLGKDTTPGAPPYVFNLIFKELLPANLDNTGFILYCDNFFVSVRLFRALHARGIYAVGPCKATCPKKDHTPNSWPFQGYAKGDGVYLGGKGWMRHATQQLAGGALHATVWLDNRFLAMLSTVSSQTSCRRSPGLSGACSPRCSATLRPLAW